MKINKKLSLDGCWKMVNAIQNVDSPEEIRRRCYIAKEWLDANEIINLYDWEDLMETVAYLCRESYHIN